jgi:hypothetical protein
LPFKNPLEGWSLYVVESLGGMKVLASSSLRTVFIADTGCPVCNLAIARAAVQAAQKPEKHS